MKLTLKSVKHNERLSRDSHCFTATLYVDNKKMFGVMDDGWGGCMETYYIKGGVKDVGAKEIEIDKVLKQTPRERKPEHDKYNLPVLDNCLEFVVCDLVNQFLQDREIKKYLRRITYMVGDEMYEVKTKPTAENIARVKQQSWWNDTNVLLNGMPIEEVRQYFK